MLEKRLLKMYMRVYATIQLIALILSGITIV